MDDRARTELETLIARKEKELSEWKEKQTQKSGSGKFTLST